MNQQCQGCQRGLPIHNGIHIAEEEMIQCTAFSAFDLEPMSRDTWHQREKRDVPFVGGGV